MATANDIIGRAHRLLGAAEHGDALSAAAYQDGLMALNAMIESWQLDSLAVYAFAETALTLTIGDASYTVGPNGNFNITPRPTKIENLFVRDSNIDYPVQLVSKDRWYAIADKTVTSDLPEFAYYEPTLSTGTLQLWPVPSKAVPLRMVTWTGVTTLAAGTTALTFPQGYERALTYNLAMDIAPELGKSPSDIVVMAARESYAALKRMNAATRPIISYTELYPLIGAAGSDIVAGGYV